MITLRKVMQKCHHFFQEHYALIWFLSIFTVVLIGYLHYELKQNNKDLIYWKNLVEFCYNELEHFALIMIMIVVLVKVLVLAIIILMNTRSLNWFDELSQLEIKKRYADFLFLRLLADIDRIENKYLRGNMDINEVLALKSFIMAHDDIRRTIENFRKDARKLLTPNEVEVSLPIEEVYGVMESEERVIRQSRFYNMDITANDELLKKLLNP